MASMCFDSIASMAGPHGPAQLDFEPLRTAVREAGGNASTAVWHCSLATGAGAARFVAAATGRWTVIWGATLAASGGAWAEDPALRRTGLDEAEARQLYVEYVEFREPPSAPEA